MSYIYPDQMLEIFRISRHLDGIPWSVVKHVGVYVRAANGGLFTVPGLRGEHRELVIHLVKDQETKELLWATVEHFQGNAQASAVRIRQTPVRVRATELVRRVAVARQRVAAKPYLPVDNDCEIAASLILNQNEEHIQLLIGLGCFVAGAILIGSRGRLAA